MEFHGYTPHLSSFLSLVGYGFSCFHLPFMAFHCSITHSILRLRPCRRPLWQCGLPNCWLGGLAIFWSAWILAGLLGFCCSVFVLLVLSNAMCASSWMLVSMSVFLALVVASLSPQLLTIALCFKTLSYDRFDGLLRCCFWLSVF